MANTQQPTPMSLQDLAFWRSVHSHTRYIYEAVEDRNISPQNNAQQVAYEALGIVHAMAHIALEDHQPLLTGLCSIQLDEGHLAMARRPSIRTPEDHA